MYIFFEKGNTKFVIKIQEGLFMTILNCSATKCIYNDHELCSRGDIQVTGENARKADETSCGSFRERGTGSAMKSTASAIDIAGCSAKDCSETKCSTFACNC